MRFFFLIILSALVTGCASQQPHTAYFDFDAPAQSARVYRPGNSSSLQAEDIRPRSELFYFKTDEGEIEAIANYSAPIDLLSIRLRTGFEQQGLSIRDNSATSISLQLTEMDVTVERTDLMVLYRAEARCGLTLTLANGRAVYTKKYHRQAHREFVNRPALEKMEDLLRESVTDIYSQILADKDIQTFIKNS